MAGVYTPVATLVSTFSALADGDNLDAASVRVWLEALADSLAFEKLGGEEIAANWHSGAALANNADRMAWSEYDQIWAASASGGTDKLETSSNFGRTWDDRVALLGSAKTIIDVAFDANGNLVAITSSRDVYKLTRTAYATWTGALTATALSAVPSGGALDFEPSSGLFVACYRVGATGMRLDTSSNGTAWTARTIPSAGTLWSGYLLAQDPQVAAGGGRVIAAFIDTTTAGQIQVAYSTNGTTYTGVTLASGIAQATLAAGSRLTRPVYDSISSTWYFAVSATGSDVCEIWKSTNGGAAWSIARTMTGSDVEIVSLAMIGRVLAAVTKKGQILTSVDAGATWKLVHANAGTATYTRIRGGGGGAILVNSQDKTCRFSERAGTFGRTIA